MKYLSPNLILESIIKLGSHHVFFGTTFLVLKQNEAPVGSMMRIGLDGANDTFLKQHYRLHPKSDYFFSPFKKARTQTNWVKPLYASKTIQTFNTQSFASALEHTTRENLWGWNRDYVKQLKQRLGNHGRVPLFHLAVWIFKADGWQDNQTRRDVCNRFIKEFHLTEEEVDALFDSKIESGLDEGSSFQDMPAKWYHVLGGYGIPEDVPPEQSGTLQLLEFEGLGPIKKLSLNPAQRLNLITGDNGLGKTFLLDLAWWALTQEWADNPIVPLSPSVSCSRVRFLVANSNHAKPVTAEFDSEAYQWNLPKHLPALSGLVVYARVDGSFAVWDPANVVLSGAERPGEKKSVIFKREEVWNGKEPQIEGLIRDWVRWQSRPDKHSAFATFEKVLKRVSPPDLGEFSIGEPVRLRGEKRDIPTLNHPYGTVPIIYESAGIRRIVTLAYLIVWAWEEHKIQAKQVGRKEERQMVILLDEAEAHLHPKWQRVLLRALLGIASDLGDELDIQFFASTHSPLIMASAEDVFESEIDKLFHLQLTESGKVSFDEMPFAREGSSDSWLQSEVFGLQFAGSAEAERALREAEILFSKVDVTRKEVEVATRKLSNHLSPENPFWMRWVLFAGDHGVEV